jgi:uncharacterized membrane protein YfcA
VAEADLALLGGVALVTAAFTAMVGLGGGIVLLSVMLFFWEPVAAIPLHGAIQLVSNSSRAVVQRRHVRWDLVLPYAIPLLPMGALGFFALQAIPASVTRAAIGVFVLAAVWAPRALLLGVHPERVPTTRRFFGLGVVTGFLNTTVGATGPLQGPFYTDLGLTRHQIVGTFAGCQTLGHLIKVGIFAAAGFAFLDHVEVLVVLSAGVLLGTGLGSLLLNRVSEPLFRGLYKVALTAVALRLVLGVWFEV